MQVDQVKSKIAKLLAIAHNSPSEAEAANAAAMAHELMQKYRIEKIAFDKDGGLIEDISDDHAPLYTSGRIAVWRSALADVLAQNNLCKAYLSYVKEGKKRKNSIKIVGTKIDADSVRHLFLYLEKEIEQLCRKYLRQKSYTKSQGRVAANSFKLGAIDRIKERLQKASLCAASSAIEDAKKNGQELAKIESALATLDGQLQRVDDWMQENLSIEKSSKIHYKEDVEAYLAGQKAGDSVSVKKDDKALI